MVRVKSRDKIPKYILDNLKLVGEIFYESQIAFTSPAWAIRFYKSRRGFVIRFIKCNDLVKKVFAEEIHNHDDIYIFRCRIEHIVKIIDILKQENSDNKELVKTLEEFEKALLNNYAFEKRIHYLLELGLKHAWLIFKVYPSTR